MINLGINNIANMEKLNEGHNLYINLTDGRNMKKVLLIQKTFVDQKLIINQRGALNLDEKRSHKNIVFSEINQRKKILTKNLVPGNTVYGEHTITINKFEYRTWDPFRSKLAAAILNGLSSDILSNLKSVLYLGVSTGTTASHVSDIIGESGILFGIEISARSARDFLENVASVRKNIIPEVADSRHPDLYTSVFQKVDMVYCDIAQPDQTRIAIENCNSFLKNSGYLFLVIKAHSIDVLKNPKDVFAEEVKKLTNNFAIEYQINLEPFDKAHSMVIAKKIN
tara:strand:+ start:63 stop:908 length:846 start_codon:yes stop_codon:yes gene_type:complete